jgi:hypothetical protein
MNKLRKLVWYAELIPKLGIPEVLFVALYRLRMKRGSLKKKFPVKKVTYQPDFFFEAQSSWQQYPQSWKNCLLAQANKIVEGQLLYYAFHWKKMGDPPDWFLNPFNGAHFPDSHSHWTELPDFNSEVGDIKNIWEASRFDWVSTLARAYSVDGNSTYINKLNAWVADWANKNPLNIGPHWKCGQETSIRVFNLMNAAHILGQFEHPAQSLIQLISNHLHRVHANINFALAQRNNHATSEAAALYIGGAWLKKVDHENDEAYENYENKGRSLLQKLAYKLFYKDGSFAQHSVTYHRVVLDTFSIVKFWSNKLDVKAPGGRFHKKAGQAIDWLTALIDESGDCPNLGSNDGAYILTNHSCDYRDFRPSIQVASALFKHELKFDTGPWNENLFWFNIDPASYPLKPIQKTSQVFDSGYVVMNDEDSWALLRFPYFKFRPGQNDIFHFDLWYKGKNLLIDSGTYSYNPSSNYNRPSLKSVLSHNTASFDDQEQMPSLSRFLLAKWIKPNEVGAIQTTENQTGYSWTGSYKDYRKNKHRRTVEWGNNNWVITDSFSGPAACVKVIFNVNVENYRIEQDQQKLVLPWGELQIAGNVEFSIVDHKISRYYQQLEKARRLIIQIPNNSQIHTFIYLY